MKELFGYILDLPNSKATRALSIGVLVILCLLSSCSIRKGIESFFLDQSISQSIVTNQKKLKSIQKQYVSSECKSIGQRVEETQLSVKQVSSTLAMLPFLFLILPKFLVSALIGRKIPTLLPVPNSWLRWSYLPLFLQNRLLLI